MVLACVILAGLVRIATAKASATPPQALASALPAEPALIAINSALASTPTALVQPATDMESAPEMALAFVMLAFGVLTVPMSAPEGFLTPAMVAPSRLWAAAVRTVCATA